MALSASNVENKNKICSILVNYESPDVPNIGILDSKGNLKSISYTEFLEMEDMKEQWAKFIKSCPEINDENELIKLHQDIVNKKNFRKYIDMICQVTVNNEIIPSFHSTRIKNIEMGSIFGIDPDDLLRKIEFNFVSLCIFDSPVDIVAQDV